MESIYCQNILNEKVNIKPNDLSSKRDIMEIINNKLTHKIEGKCIKQGYVKKGSLKIINRSVGKIYDGHFSGDIVYKIKFSVEVCNPPEGQIINCIIYNNNKMGIIAGIGENSRDSPLMILLPRHHHQDKDIFRDVDVGDSITIEIVGKKFELNDEQIHVVGSLLGKNKKEKGKEIKIKKKKKKGAGINNLDISDKQNIDQRMQIIEKYIRSKEKYDGDLLPVINNIKSDIKLDIWDSMEISEKNDRIEEIIQYLDAENEIKKIYGEKWDHLTSVDRKNLIKSKIDNDSNTSFKGIQKIETSNNDSYSDSDNDSSILEI